MRKSASTVPAVFATAYLLVFGLDKLASCVGFHVPEYASRVWMGLDLATALSVLGALLCDSSLPKAN